MIFERLNRQREIFIWRVRGRRGGGRWRPRAADGAERATRNPSWRSRTQPAALEPRSDDSAQWIATRRNPCQGHATFLTSQYCPLLVS